MTDIPHIGIDIDQLHPFPLISPFLTGAAEQEIINQTDPNSKLCNFVYHYSMYLKVSVSVIIWLINHWGLKNLIVKIFILIKTS